MKKVLLVGCILIFSRQSLSWAQQDKSKTSPRKIVYLFTTPLGGVPAKKLVSSIDSHPNVSAFNLTWTLGGIQMHEKVNIRYNRSRQVLYYDSSQVAWDDRDKEHRFRQSIRFTGVSVPVLRKLVKLADTNEISSNDGDFFLLAKLGCAAFWGESQKRVKYSDLTE